MNSRSEHFPLDEHNLTGITNFLLKRKETIAVAESVTSGAIQNLFSRADQATHFFQGGITTYNLSQKVMHLGIDPVMALANNCVSREIAREMAIGVTRMFKSDWGLAITGYAVAIPEAGIDKLFAYYSFAYRGKEVSTSMLLSRNMDSRDVQQYYSSMVLQNFKHFLSSHTAWDISGHQLAV